MPDFSVDTVKIIGALLAQLMGLAVVVFSAVAYLKQWGVSGKWLTGASFAFGLAFGMLFRYAVSPMATFADWFWAATFGLMAGFLASGAYKGVDDLLSKNSPIVTIAGDDFEVEAKLLTTLPPSPAVSTETPVHPG